MRNKKSLLIVHSGLFATLIMIFTALLKIPTALGYINLGDGMIFASAAALGPFAAIAGGIGSVLADLLAGYPIYIPATLIIKSAMGCIAAKLIVNHGVITMRNILVYTLAEMVMVAGYFVFECFTFNVAAASVSLLSNLLQGATGVMVGTLFSPLISRIYASKHMHG